MNGPELERRYRRWLRLYPRPYRREREAELLSTLMDAAEPGQRRPAPREVVSLVVGALRVRAGTPRRHTPSDRWLSMLRLSTLLLLAHAGAQSAAYAGRVVFSELLQPYALFAVAGTSLLWMVFDPRAPMAVGVLLVCQVLSLLGFYLPGWGNGRAETRGLLLSYAAAAAVLAVAGALTTRRQARL